VIHGEHLVSELLKIKGDDKDKHCESRRFKYVLQVSNLFADLGKIIKKIKDHLLKNDQDHIFSKK
jgi:hypothetical protein